MLKQKNVEFILMRKCKGGVPTPTETPYNFDFIYFKFQVQFARKVFPENIDIYETFNSGSVNKIQVMQPDSKWYTAWETDTCAKTEGEANI